MNIIIKFPYIGIIPGTNLHLKQTFFIFWSKFAQKRYFYSKTGQINVSIKFSLFESGQVPSFILNKHF